MHENTIQLGMHMWVASFTGLLLYLRMYVCMCVCLWHLNCAFHLMTGACRLPDYLGGQEEEERNDGTAFGAEWGEVSRLG